MTHTVALMDVSPATHAEIEKALRTAGYDHAIEHGVLDMSGLALVCAAESDTPKTEALEGVREPFGIEFLCRIWGEDIDHTLTAIVPDWDGVRRFCIEHWTGSDDATDYDGSLTLDNLKTEFDEHEADERGTYTQTWEIGGVSIERICNCSPVPAAPRSAAPDLAITNFDPLTIARRVCRSVAEIGDRNSPEDQPDMMLVTADELLTIVVEALAENCPPEATASKDGQR